LYGSFGSYFTESEVDRSMDDEAAEVEEVEELRRNLR
jgi:hypothetical protein